MKLPVMLGLLMGCLCGPICYGQSESSSFTLGVICPESSNDLNAAQLQALQTRIVQIISNSNEATAGYGNDMVLYPVVTVSQSEVAEGGMESFTVTTIDLSLFVRQLSSKLVFATLSRHLKGTGNDRKQSISNAINQIRTDDNAYAQFIATAKKKIIQYYIDNCQAIIRTADDCAARHEYERAISLLQTIPTSACYADARAKSLEYYKKYQEIVCPKYMLKAKEALAVNDYAGALAALRAIDPAAGCYAEVSKLIDQISDKYDVKMRRDSGLTAQKMAADLSLEQQRVNAMKDIAVAYYSNAFQTTTYYSLTIW